MSPGLKCRPRPASRLFATAGPGRRLPAGKSRTGPVPLPCSLLTGYFAPLERLGPDCRFAGRAWAEQSSDGWNGGLTGQFQAVALDQVIEPFPHKLSGTAEVVLDHLEFRGGRLYEAAGIVDCGGGVVSRPLLTRLADAYRCEKSPRLEQAESALIEFERLAVRFELGDEGLQLRGLCSDGTPGVLITDRRGPLVMEAEIAPNRPWHSPKPSPRRALFRYRPRPNPICCSARYPFPGKRPMPRGQPNDRDMLPSASASRLREPRRGGPQGNPECRSKPCRLCRRSPSSLSNATVYSGERVTPSRRGAPRSRKYG